VGAVEKCFVLFQAWVGKAAQRFAFSIACGSFHGDPRFRSFPIYLFHPQIPLKNLILLCTLCLLWLIPFTVVAVQKHFFTSLIFRLIERIME
jgi:hypothetical protein